MQIKVLSDEKMAPEVKIERMLSVKIENGGIY